jgi:hypothetical protein
MRKLCVGLFGILACATSINADGFSESDRGLIAGKDNPFPPDESTLPEADDSTGSDDTNGSPQSAPQQSNGRSEKDYVPESEDDDN